MKLKLLSLFSLITALSIGLSLSAQKSFNVSFQHKGKTIYGTFLRPDDTGRFVTIIICPGSGANDRNGTLEMVGGNVQCLYPDLLNDTLHPYKELAEKLVDSGFAVFRYDKIEYTYTNPSSLGTITFEKLWLPFESAINYLKTRTDVDSGKFVLIGHSEGSSLIPYVARRHKEVKALISLAGPRTSFDTLLAFQIRDFTKKCQGDTVNANSQADQILLYYDLVRSGLLTGNTPVLFGVSPDVWKVYLQVTDSVAINYNLCFQKKLFIGLGNDLNVPPKELDRFKADVNSTDFWRIPGLIHYMNPNANPHVSEALSDTIVYWLRSKRLGINEIHKDQNLKLQVYPNPINGDFISLNLRWNLPDMNKIEIYNSDGKLVYTQEIQQEIYSADLNIGQMLLKGTYLIKVSNQTSLCTSVFIVE